MDMGLEEEGVVGSSHLVEEVVRSFEVGSSLAGVGTAVVDLHILHEIRVQGIVTCLAG